MKCRRHASKVCIYCNRPAAISCGFVDTSGAVCGTRICGQCERNGECRIHEMRGDHRWAAFMAVIVIFCLMLGK